MGDKSLELETIQMLIEHNKNKINKHKIKMSQFNILNIFYDYKTRHIRNAIKLNNTGIKLNNTLLKLLEKKINELERIDDKEMPF